MTIEIPDGLYRSLKSRAAGEDVPTEVLILHGVKRLLERGNHKPSKRVKLPITRSSHPETLILNNAKIFAIISFP